MSLEIRRIRPDDGARLSDLFAILGADSQWFHPHPLTSDEAHRLATGFPGRRDVYAVCLHSDAPVAYVLLRGWDDGFSTPSLGIAVHPDWKGRKIGRLMMAFLHAEARLSGARDVLLKVYVENVVACTLYESLGYVWTGTQDGQRVYTLTL
jgi:ribosomal protein S18 acetylase RimI-like enzyme